MYVAFRHGLAVMAGALALLLTLTGAQARDGKVSVVAAENFYGDIARQIGGDRVTVSSILNNPDQDPHLFETAPGVVRQIAEAQIVVLNGANYDHWMEKLIQAAPRAERTVIDVARHIKKKPGNNPHIWYDPAAMPAAAKALAAALAKADPTHAADYDTRLKAVLADLARIDARIADMRARHQGKPVTATEPVFGPMTDALGLVMRNERFQRAMMNDTEPSARDIAAFENDLKQRKVKVLIYNSQVSEKLTERLRDIARAAKVPVVGVTEVMPANVTFQDWVLSQLAALDKALGDPGS